MAHSDLDILFVLAPPWGATVPPLGPAFLLGAARRAGLSAGFLDLNARMLRDLGTRPTDDPLAGKIAEAGGVGCFDDLWAFGNSTSWSLQFADRILQASAELLGPLWARIETDRPRVAGFSIYGLNIHFSFFVAHHLKRRFPDTRIVFGGPWTAFSPHLRILADSPIDAVFLDEGDDAIQAIVRFLAGDNLPPDWTVHREGRLPVLRAPQPELTADIAPDYDGIDLGLYEPGTFASQIGRGCPNRCRFCSDRTLTRCRRRAPEAIFAELEGLRDERGLRHVQFADLTLNAHPRHLRTVLEWMEGNLPGVTWDANLAIQPDIDAGSAARMKRSGCIGVQLGLESGSDRVLDAMGKRFDAARAAEVIRILDDAGVAVRVNLLVGFPGEDETGFAETCDFVRKHAPRIAGINTMNAFYLDRGQATFDDLSRFTLPDPRHPVVGWASEGNTFAIRTARFREIRDLCMKLGLLHQEVFPEWEREAVEPPSVRGTFADTTWTFADGSVVLARRFRVLTAGSGLLLDWDVDGKRTLSTGIDWRAASDKSAVAKADGLRLELRIDDQGDELVIELSASSAEPVSLSRLKASLLVADVFRRWSIGSREGPTPAFDYFAPRWQAVAPEDENGRLPLDDGYRWTGPREWMLTGDDATTLRLAAETGSGALAPILQANCFPGVSVGFVATGVPVTREPQAVLRLRLRTS